MTGEAFGLNSAGTGTVDHKDFDPKAWVRGTATVTRSVTVFGRADLMGELEALKAQLEREQQSTSFDGDERTLMLSRVTQLSREFEAKRQEMYDSAIEFKLRGLRDGELEELREEMGRDDPNPNGVSELDYRVLARQCVFPAGFDWTDFQQMHQNMGKYFLQTLVRTSNAASEGGVVDVPFSSVASARTASSSTS